MTANLNSLIAALRADPGLKANVPASQINKGIAAVVQLNSVLLNSINITHSNDDSRLDVYDMKKVAAATYANPAQYVKFLEGHGNDNGTREDGYHYLQNDGGSLVFQGRNFADTVADAIYHFGFKISNGRYVNEDGNANERADDVAGWLNFFLNGRNVVYGDSTRNELHSGEYSAYFAAARNETFYAGAGNDKIWADIGNDRVYGGTGNDISGGGKGLDRLFGESGNDTLYGDEGADSIYGGSGRDQIGGGDQNDLIFGGLGYDKMSGQNGNDILYGGADFDTVAGDNGNDRVFGGTGRDELYGGAGNDILDGGTGNDRIIGNEGADFLRGGAGADTFVLYEDGKSRDTIYIGKDDSGKTLATMDHVEGFQHGVDKINLNAFGDMSVGAIDYRGGGQASVYYDGRFLRIDADGNATTDLMIEFKYVSTLTAGDFIFA